MVGDGRGRWWSGWVECGRGGRSKKKNGVGGGGGGGWWCVREMRREALRRKR